MTSLAIMQPYWFPYLGYFQLFNAVDRFMLLDVVNHKPRGWVNRNRILINHRPRWLNLPLANASKNILIQDLQCHDKEKFSIKLLKTLHDAYAKAPYFPYAMPVFEAILTDPQTSFVSSIESMLKHIGSYLAIDTPIIRASQQTLENSSARKNRIIALCQQQDAQQCINLAGGETIYNKQHFADCKIELMFMRMRPLKYDQYKEPFSPSLSIIDVMMFNSPKKIQEYLKHYDLC